MGRNYQKPDKKHGGPEKLLKWANEAKDFKEGRRFLCIRMLMLKEAEATINEAALNFGVSPRTVNQWIRQWNQDGKEGLMTTPQPGRPSKFKQVHKDRIRELIDNQAQDELRLTIKGVHGFLKE